MTLTTHSTAAPAEAAAKLEKRRQMDELMELAARATDDHIRRLPAAHQPIVRMLRSMRRDAAEKSHKDDLGGHPGPRHQRLVNDTTPPALLLVD